MNDDWCSVCYNRWIPGKLVFYGKGFHTIYSHVKHQKFSRQVNFDPFNVGKIYKHILGILFWK